MRIDIIIFKRINFVKDQARSLLYRVKSPMFNWIRKTRAFRICGKSFWRAVNSEVKTSFDSQQSFADWRWRLCDLCGIGPWKPTIFYFFWTFIFPRKIVRDVPNNKVSDLRWFAFSLRKIVFFYGTLFFFSEMKFCEIIFNGFVDCIW